MEKYPVDYPGEVRECRHSEWHPANNEPGVLRSEEKPTGDSPNVHMLLGSGRPNRPTAGQVVEVVRAEPVQLAEPECRDLLRQPRRDHVVANAF